MAIPRQGGAARRITRGAVAIVAAWTLVWSGVPAPALAQVADSPRFEEGTALEEKRPDDAASATPLAGEAPASEPAPEVAAPDEPSAKPDEAKPQDDGNAKEAAPADVAEEDGPAVSTQASGEILASGTWGTCKWEVDSDYTLHVHAGRGLGSLVSDYALRGSIKAVVFDDGVVFPENCNSLFAGFPIESLDLSNVDVSGVTDMLGMFRYCRSLKSLDVSGWDTSSVEDMSQMFCKCSSLSSLDASGWDTSSVTRTAAMFYGCESLESLDVSGWDTSSVEHMGASIGGDMAGGMFEGCSKLRSLDVSGWNVSSVQRTGTMFSGCSSLESLDLSGWDTPALTDAGGMFNGCSSLKSLDLSGWNTSSVDNMSHMFCDCSSLSSLDVSGWNVENVKGMHGLFMRCSSLESLDLSGWDTKSVEDMGEMFNGCSDLDFLDVSGWRTPALKSMSADYGGEEHGMFQGCSSLRSLDLSGWNTSEVTGMACMFSGCKELSSLDLSGWDTSEVDAVSGFFSGCTSLERFVVGEGYEIRWDDMFPDAKVADGWWSAKGGKWLTKDDIVDDAERSGGFADTYTAYEASERTSIADAEVELPDDLAYTGRALRPVPKVTIGDGTTLTVGVDFTCAYENNVNAAAATDAAAPTVTITGIGRYKESKSATFGIAKAEISPSVSVDGWTYGELANEPSVAGNPGDADVTFGYKARGAGDETYVAAAPTEAGEYTVRATVVESDNHLGGTATADFEIAKAAISPTVSVDGWTYGEAASEPSVAGNPGGADVTFGYKARGAGDEAYVPTAPTGAGQYTVRATVAESTNHLGGTATADFEIAPADLSGASVTVPGAPVAFDGSPRVPAPSVSLGGRTLSAGADYAVSYSDNLLAGTAGVTVTGRGNYRGSAAATFTISRADLSSARITLPSRSYARTGRPIEPAPTVTLGAAPLVAGRDYDVSYSGNVGVGTATVTVTGRGSCLGSASATFEVYEPVARVDMYRLYNPNSGEHFYTANADEKNILVGLGWNYEGVGWVAPDRSNSPVYRLYNPNAGDHHYTTSASERDHLVSVGWIYEGVGWHSDDARGVPLYRQYNPNAMAGTHNYTTSRGENDMLVAVGWRAEGIGWYGMR